MRAESPNAMPLAVLIMAIAVIMGGWFIGNGYRSGQTADRFVTVKGLAERDVTADLAIWPLQLVAASDRLADAQASLDRDEASVLAFLAEHGIDASNVALQGVEVTDNMAIQYGPGERTGPRYIVQQILMVRSEDPASIQRASQAIGDLVGAGVVLKSGQGWGPAQPTYVFKQLNALKPEMIAEATSSAREAARQFAADSETELGGIRRANQGVFVILPRDEAPGIQEQTQLEKTVRVVATVDYYLD